MDDGTNAPSRPLHVLLAGGGSGGHVFPALAIGEALAARGWRVSFVGTANGMEARLVPARGVEFHALPAMPMVGRGGFGKLRGGVTLVRSAVAARSLVRRLGAEVVVGTGGYVSAPAVLGARLAGRPAILVEPNARAGVANRFLSRFARGAALGVAGAARDLRCPSVVTGVPLRREFARAAEPLPMGSRVLVLGGSQGARRLNELLPAALASAAARIPGLEVVHQAGERWIDAARTAYERAGVVAEVVPFIDDVARAMAEASLIVSRSGANTLAEIACAGRPALLLPLAAAGAHQLDNARAFAAAGAADVFTDGPASELLVDLLVGLLGDRPRLERLASAARGLAKPEAAAAVAELVERAVSAAAPGGGR